MYYFNSNSSLETSGFNSSMFNDSCIQDISSIPNASIQDSQKHQWPSLAEGNNSEFLTPQKTQNTDFGSVYSENLKLKRKIKDLQDTLKKINSMKTVPEDSMSEFTQSTYWLLSEKPSFFEDTEDEEHIKRNLQPELEAVSDSSRSGRWNFNFPFKRERKFSSGKTPHKFFKVALMGSIGTLKF